MTKRRLLFLGPLLFWIVSIGGFILIKQNHLSQGKAFYFKTAPVDPRDIFRGDYVNLSYEISNIRVDPLIMKVDDSVKNLRPGDTIYVMVTNDVPLYLNNELKYTSRWYDIKTQSPLDGDFITGRVESAFVDGNDVLDLRVKYGIESYFVPEHKGLEIEKSVGKDLYGKVILDKNGVGLLDSLILNGEEIKFYVNPI